MLRGYDRLGWHKLKVIGMTVLCVPSPNRSYANSRRSQQITSHIYTQRASRLRRRLTRVLERGHNTKSYLQLYVICQVSLNENLISQTVFVILLCCFLASFQPFDMPVPGENLIKNHAEGDGLEGTITIFASRISVVLRTGVTSRTTHRSIL